MRHEEFEAMVEAMCLIESVEDFESVAVERELNPGTLVVLPAGLAMRLFWNEDGPELCAEWFAAMEELREIDRAFDQIINEQEGTDEDAPQQDQR